MKKETLILLIDESVVLIVNVDHLGITSPNNSLIPSFTQLLSRIAGIYSESQMSIAVYSTSKMTCLKVV